MHDIAPAWAEPGAGFFSQPVGSGTAPTSFVRWNCPFSKRPVITSSQKRGQSEPTVLTKAIARPCEVWLNSAVTTPLIGWKSAVGRMQYLPVPRRLIDRIPAWDVILILPLGLAAKAR